MNQDKKNYSSRHPGIRLITTKSALGLEFKAVIIPWVQQFGVGDESEAKRELYVSMTRATDILCLFGSGRFPVLRELTATSIVESMPVLTAAVPYGLLECPTKTQSPQRFLVYAFGAGQYSY